MRGADKGMRMQAGGESSKSALFDLDGTPIDGDPILIAGVADNMNDFNGAVQARRLTLPEGVTT